MSDRTWYQGVPSSATVLILGEVFEERPPITVAIQFGQEAYETYQTKVYVESLLMTRHHPTYVDWSPLFCSLYAGIIATGARQVVELGSTLFATIDKLNKLQRLSNGPSVSNLEFIGVEPSNLFCRLTEALHSTSNIRHVGDVTQLPAVDERSVNRCYQATSYALNATEELVDYCARSMFGCHGIWFSHDGSNRTVCAMGKPLTLFSLPRFLAGMTSRGYLVEFIQKSHSSYANEFEFFETWLVYHRLNGDETRVFRHWLSKLRTIVNDGAELNPSFEVAPLRERADSGFSALEDTSRRLDFTSDHALRRLADWRRSLENPQDGKEH